MKMETPVTPLDRKGVGRDSAVDITAKGTALSQEQIERWLCFQFKPASYIDASYRTSLLGSANNLSRTSNKDEDSGGKIGNGDKILSLLWGKPILSRYLCDFFALEFANFPSQSSALSFFTRIAMLDGEDLQHLLIMMGLLLSSHELSLIIDRDAVLEVREGLGRDSYDFATNRGRFLCPSRDWIALSLSANSRSRLSDRFFHLELGLRLLLQHSKEVLDEQSLKRLGLKCPYDVVRRVEEGSGADLEVAIAIFETMDEGSRKESLWCNLVKEELGQWHDWLVS